MGELAQNRTSRVYGECGRINFGAFLLSALATVTFPAAWNWYMHAAFLCSEMTLHCAETLKRHRSTARSLLPPVTFDYIHGSCIIAQTPQSALSRVPCHYSDPCVRARCLGSSIIIQIPLLERGVTDPVSLHISLC
jgi:hypothetical protein